MISFLRPHAPALLASLLFVISGCSSSGKSQVDLDARNEAESAFEDLYLEEDDATGLDAEEEDAPSVEELVDEPDVVEPAGVCGYPELAVCEASTAAPTTKTAISNFVMNNAFRLRCAEAGEGGWDFSVYGEEFAGQQAFFMGEVHGSNEIGQTSADLFEYLVRNHGVRVLALEIGMDTTADLQDFVATGDPASMQATGSDMYGDNMFRQLLPERAHELVLEGYEIDVVGVDVPQRLAWVNEQLEDVAGGMDDPVAAGLLLETLPPPREIQSYGMFGLETAYVDQAEIYYQMVMDNLEAICAALEDEEECEKVEYLAYSLWIGAVFVSQDFMMGSMGGGDQSLMMQMMMEREQILIWTFEQAIPSDDTRLYAHMGAAHASKGSWNVAGQLDKFYPITKNQVYTVTPAYGPGSAIFYGYSSQSLPTEPKILGEALSTMPEDRYFLSTGSPGLDCTANPYKDEVVIGMGGQYGSSYDSFLFYRQLTADKPGGMWYVGNSAWEQFFIDQVERLRYAQELMFRTHDFN